MLAMYGIIKYLFCILLGSVNVRLEFFGLDSGLYINYDSTKFIVSCVNGLTSVFRLDSALYFLILLLRPGVS